MKGACLLLHGFAGTPFEMEPLAPALQSLGYTVEIPLLPGHGTTVADFRTTFFADWLHCAEKHLLHLQQTHEKVIIAGLSMGGALALILAARHAPAGIVTLAAPLFTHRIIPWQVADWRLLIVPLLKYFIPEVPLRPSSPQSRSIAPYQGYEAVMCLPQLHSLMQGLALARKSLPAITCPTLIMHDVHDTLAASDSALMIARDISSADVALIYTCIQEKITTRHLLTTHIETRAEVAQAVAKFASRLVTLGE